MKMWYQQIFVFSVYMLLRQANAGSESRFNGDTSDLLATQQQQQQQELSQEQQQLQVNLKAWQPLSGHNNWLILQATAATSMQHQRQQQQQHRLPVNYYAYNHRYNPRSNSPNDATAAAASGNYKQVRANLNESPSYVLAISQTMPLRGVGAGEGRRGSEIDKDEMRRQLPPPELKNVQEVDMRAEPEARDVNDIMALNNAVDDVTQGIEKPTASNLAIDNYLTPFKQVALKVLNFCDTLRSLINEEDGDAENENVSGMEQQLSPDATSLSSRLDAKAEATSKEAQGRYSRLASTYQSRKLKKLKKKIQKLFLPLLIAYKLKFLTLIPVLIGGLTLLVGTTGLAGFFFALFTAVMSLKTSTGGHGSKAIILKKI